MVVVGCPRVESVNLKWNSMAKVDVLLIGERCVVEVGYTD